MLGALSNLRLSDLQTDDGNWHANVNTLGGHINHSMAKAVLGTLPYDRAGANYIEIALTYIPLQ